MWIQYPVRVVEGVIGMVALPTMADLKRQENRLSNVQSELENAELALQNSDDPVSSVRANYEIVKARFEVLSQQFNKTKEAIERAEREGIGEVRLYEILPNTYKESLIAEDNAREWPGGEPRINTGRMILGLLYNHVRLNGELLTPKEIDALEPTVAQTIGNELYSIIYPDLTALPFWSQRSKTS